MSREKNLVKNTVVLGIGKVLPRFASFITLPILTAYLTKAEYGTYDLIDTLISLIIPIATLQIQSAAFRFLIDCRGDDERTSQIISNIFVVTLPITLIAGLIMPLFFPSFTFVMKALLCAYFILDTVHMTVAQVTRGLGNNKAYSMSAILLSITRMAGIVLCVYFGKQGLTGVLISLVAAQCAGIANNLRCTHLFKYIRAKLISFSQVKMLIAYSAGMVPNNLSNWVLKLSDRMVITAALGIEANAVYAVANKIPNLMTVAQNVLIMAWQENASIAVNDEDASEYYTRMLDSIFSLMFGITALLIAASPLLFAIFIKGDYDQAYYQMPVLILAMFFCVVSAFFGGIYIAHKKTASIGISTTVAAAVNLLIDLTCVHIIGVWAGSISTLVAYFLLYVYRAFSCRKFQPLHIYWGRQIAMSAIMAAMIGLCFLRTPLGYAVNAAAGIAFFCIFNRGMIKVLWNKTLGKLRKSA